jgi:hemoglobin-like flavoprotein
MSTRLAREKDLREGHMNWQVDMLEQSMTKLAPMGEKVAARFYEALFEEYPGLRPLFHGVSMEGPAQQTLVGISLYGTGFSQS